MRTTITSITLAGIASLGVALPATASAATSDAYAYTSSLGCNRGALELDWQVTDPSLAPSSVIRMTVTKAGVTRSRVLARPADSSLAGQSGIFVGGIERINAKRTSVVRLLVGTRVVSATRYHENCAGVVAF
jgi:hypothetical protein